MWYRVASDSRIFRSRRSFRSKHDVIDHAFDVIGLARQRAGPIIFRLIFSLADQVNYAIDRAHPKIRGINVID